MCKNGIKKINISILGCLPHCPDLAQLVEHSTVVVSKKISKGHLFESGNREKISIQINDLSCIHRI